MQKLFNHIFKFSKSIWKIIAKILKSLPLIIFSLLIILISIKTFKSEDLKNLRKNENLKVVFISTNENLNIFESAYIIHYYFKQKKVLIFPITGKTRFTNPNEKPLYLQDIYKKIFNSHKNNLDINFIFAEFIKNLNEFYKFENDAKLEYYIHFSRDKIKIFNERILKSHKLNYDEIISYNFNDEIVFNKYKNTEIFLKSLTIFNVYKFWNLKFKLFSKQYMYDLKQNFKNITKQNFKIKFKNILEKTNKELIRICNECNVSFVYELKLKDFSFGNINDSNIRIFYILSILIEYKNLFDGFKIIFITNNNILNENENENFYIKDVLEKNLKNNNDKIFEKPILEVLNGTDEKGLSLKITRELRDNNFDIQKWGNYPFKKDITMIIDRKNTWENANIIHSFLNKGIVFSKPDKNSFFDVTIVLGKDIIE
ncbi:MAG: LytR C-terminal domain-containing protein [Elusimicrobiota bacterium]|jgi:hypothetical protein|nr:LytR C-terminal domain-containing protein [Elusimicrobiota bacterium]